MDISYLDRIAESINRGVARPIQSIRAFLVSPKAEQLLGPPSAEIPLNGQCDREEADCRFVQRTQPENLENDRRQLEAIKRAGPRAADKSRAINRGKNLLYLLLGSILIILPIAAFISDKIIDGSLKRERSAALASPITPEALERSGEGDLEGSEPDPTRPLAENLFELVIRTENPPPRLREALDKHVAPAKVRVRLIDAPSKTTTIELATNRGVAIWSRSTADRDEAEDLASELAAILSPEFVKFWHSGVVLKSDEEFLGSRIGTVSLSDLKTYLLDVSDQREKKLESIDGKASVIHFWATWCLPCMAEMDDLSRLAADFQETADFIGIADDRRSSETMPETVQRVSRAVLQFQPLRRQYIIDSKKNSFQEIFYLRDVPLPAFALFSRQGILLDAFAGVVADPTSYNRKRIEAFLKGQASLRHKRIPASQSGRESKQP